MGLNKEDVKYFQRCYEEKNKKALTDHQKDIVYRCFLLGLKGEETELVLQSDSPQKEEYIIASFLDGISRAYVEQELLSENRIETIQSKRLDYLLEKLRSTDPKYLALQNEVDKLTTFRVAAEEQSEVLLKRLKLTTKEMMEMQNTKQQLTMQVEQLKNEIKRQKENLKGVSKRPSEKQKLPVFAENNIRYEAPSSFLEKLKFLFFGEMAARTVEKGEDMIELLCNPKFSLQQLKELQRGYLDGIPYTELKKLARPELPVEIIKEMRYFMCERLGLSKEDMNKNTPVESYEKSPEPPVDDSEIFLDEDDPTFDDG